MFKGTLNKTITRFIFWVAKTKLFFFHFTTLLQRDLRLNHVHQIATKLNSSPSFGPNKQCFVLEVELQQIIIKSGNGQKRSPLKTHFQFCSRLFLFVFVCFVFFHFFFQGHRSSCVITGFHYVVVAFPAQRASTRRGAETLPGTRHHHLMAKLK